MITCTLPPPGAIVHVSEIEPSPLPDHLFTGSIARSA